MRKNLVLKKSGGIYLMRFPGFSLIIALFLSLFFLSCIVENDLNGKEKKGGSGDKPVEGKLSKELKEAMETLNYFNDDKDPQRRIAAITLGISRHPGVVDSVNSHLEDDRDPLVKANCAWAAGRIVSLKSLPILIKATESGIAMVRHEAILALGNYKDSHAKNILRKIAEETGGQDSLYAYKALKIKNPPGIKVAVEKQVGDESAKDGKAFYVDASVGKDGNPGDKARPFLTMAKGVSMLKKGRGDTLYASSGKSKIPFREKVIISGQQGGVPFAPTVIRNWPGKPAPMVFPSINIKPKPGDKLLATATIDKKVLAVFLVGPKDTRILNGVESLEKMTPMSFFYNENDKLLMVMGPKHGFGSFKIEAGVYDDGILVKNADHVQVIGFTVAYAQDTGIDFAGSRYGVVRDVTVSDCDRHGIFFYYSPFSIITDSEVFGCRYQGISIRSSSHTLVSQCYAHNNTHDGILFLFDSNSCVASGCRLEKNGRGIAFITGSSQGRVFGNAFSKNGKDVVFEKGSPGSKLPSSKP